MAAYSVKCGVGVEVIEGIEVVKEVLSGRPTCIITAPFRLTAKPAIICVEKAEHVAFRNISFFLFSIIA